MSIRILIADDHAIFRSGLKALLAMEKDLSVIGETGTGAETVAAVGKLKCDILVLDISLPDMTGPRIAEEVLKIRPSLGIVILTMHEDDYYMRESLQSGVKAYVLKKSTGTDLLRAIRAVSRGERYIDPAMASHIISSYVGQPDNHKGEGLVVLSAREREVCSLLALGHTNKEIAKKLGISERTAESHRMNIMKKLKINSRAALVRFAIKTNLLQPK